WHEIAQWFGMTSVGGWSELASAFSPEDLYSNMLGAILARDILQTSPQISLNEFSQQLSAQLVKQLIAFGAVDRATTKTNINALDGQWWDSRQRLPDKWVLQQRDYRMLFNIIPHGAEVPVALSLTDNISELGQLQLVAAGNESHFAALPAALSHQSTWYQKDFSALAQFALSQDKLIKPDVQIAPNN
ncbi:DUF4056 domain-containing protein, partial [Shewanella sp.]|uniref:DUF4056 domain-containing protein n=1 Tax=Shewanella sp. TaxID=50422 RepID=UPI003F2F6121